MLGIQINPGLYQRFLHFSDVCRPLRYQRLGRQRICRHLVACGAPVRYLFGPPTLLLLKQCRHQLFMLQRDFAIRNMVTIDKSHACRCRRITFLECGVTAPHIAVIPVRRRRANRVEVNVCEALRHIVFAPNDHAIVVCRLPKRSFVTIPLVVFHCEPLFNNLHEAGNTVHSLTLPVEPFLNLALARLAVNAPSCK